jgi:hypothetical protein
VYCTLSRIFSFSFIFEKHLKSCVNQFVRNYIWNLEKELSLYQTLKLGTDVSVVMCFLFPYHRVSSLPKSPGFDSAVGQAPWSCGNHASPPSVVFRRPLSFYVPAIVLLVSIYVAGLVVWRCFCNNTSFCCPEKVGVTNNNNMHGDSRSAKPGDIEFAMPKPEEHRGRWIDTLFMFSILL